MVTGDLVRGVYDHGHIPLCDLDGALTWALGELDRSSLPTNRRSFRQARYMDMLGANASSKCYCAILMSWLVSIKLSPDRQCRQTNFIDICTHRLCYEGVDIELARTFIEIVSTGSFIKAADRLHVAQTTVSARVRLLEQQLGRPLFVRNKGGASLTPAGEQFLRFAPSFCTVVAARKQQVAVPEGHRAVLTVGSEVSLWQPLLLRWVRMMRHSHPDIALRVHVDVPQDLITHVAAGLVDIAIMYAPQHRPGLEIDLLYGGRARTGNN